MACGCMRYAQLRFCANDFQKVTQMTGNRYRETDVWTDRHIILTGSQFGDKCILMLEPTLEIITNTKVTKGLWRIGYTDRYIILPLRGFDPVAYSRMCWSQLQAAEMITKH